MNGTVLDYYKTPSLFISRDKKGRMMDANDNVFNASVTAYNPDQRVKDRTAEVIREFWYMRYVQTKSYAEFNDMDVLTRQTKNQKSFNIWTPKPSDDPAENWKSDAFRPIVRNKIISIAAHLAQAMIYPNISALNKDNEEDKDAAKVMRDLIEWVSEEYDYPVSFIYAVITALVNPAAIVHTEYAEVYRHIKEIQADGTWKEKKVLDDVFSGFRDTILSCDELFIADAYIRDIQQQPSIVWRRAIEYETAYAKYHGNPMFDQFVQPGIILLFDAQTVLFYRQYDENLRGKLVEEILYWNRSKDLQLSFVNGVLLCDPDQPNKRLDKLYPFAKTGFEIYNHRFFYYMAAAQKMAKDEEVVNDTYRILIDASKLQGMPPVAVAGEDMITSDVMVPGAAIALKSDTKVNPINFQNNMRGLMDVLQKVEGSIDETTADFQGGQDQPGNQTAFEISKIQENAKKLLGLFARMISDLVKQWGKLRVSDIIQHLTVGQADEILDQETALKFHKFLLPPKAGRKTARHIVFDPDLHADVKKMPKDKKGKPLDYDTFAQEGHTLKDGKLNEGDKEIARVHPESFRQLKYKIVYHPDSLLPPSDVVKRALNLEEYDRAIANPLANQETIFKDLLLGSYSETRDNPDHYVQKQQPQMGQPDQGGQGAKPNAAETLGNVMGGSKLSSKMNKAVV